MGRGKRKRKAKLKKKRIKKIKQGKIVPFTIANCSNKLKGISNKYEYKINVHHCNFCRAKFKYVRYRSGHVTESSFKSSNFTNVDFISVNLKKNKFKNANFIDVVFFNCNLEEVNFKNAKFNNVYFINCKLKNLKEFCKTNSTYIIMKYKKTTICNYLEYKIGYMCNIPKLEKYHILTTKENKINYWMLNILLTEFTMVQISKFFSKLIQNNKQQFFTINDYRKSLQRYYKK